MDDASIVRLVRGDTDYPPGLLDLDDPPPSLVVCGAVRVPPVDAVAIVGARAATPYGLEWARRLALDLGRLGYAIVSGLARGIDAAAHRGALEAGACTIAVLPAGIRQIVPPSHRELSEQIVATGALASEWEDGGPLQRAMFLKRNRLIAALSRATIVVEAAERSGALSTATVARRLGRPVLAVPGDIDRATSRGCHALLRSGAALCESAADVVQAIEAGSRAAATPATAANAAAVRSPRERLLGALEDGPIGLDRLVAIAGVEAGAALTLLLELEWAGLVTALPGQRWTRRTAAA